MSYVKNERGADAGYPLEYQLQQQQQQLQQLQLQQHLHIQQQLQQQQQLQLSSQTQKPENCITTTSTTSATPQTYPKMDYTSTADIQPNSSTSSLSFPFTQETLDAADRAKLMYNMDFAKLGLQSPHQLPITTTTQGNTASSPPPGTVGFMRDMNKPLSISNGYPQLDERSWPGYAQAYQAQSPIDRDREIKWAEIKRLMETMRRCVGEYSQGELTKDKYVELYNLSVNFLRAVDTLDPEKRKSELGALSGQPQLPVEVDMFGRKISFDYFRRNSYEVGNFYGMPQFQPPGMAGMAGMAYPYPVPPGVGGAYSIFPVPPQQAQQQGTFVAPQTRSPDPKKQNDQYFDETQDSDRRPKRRRKRTMYSARRNLRCHMCGVTETPEWRRGPEGDHTLCNACGLHYAKALKKERKAREGRKHSIDILLNDQRNQNADPSVPVPNNIKFDGDGENQDAALSQIDSTDSNDTDTEMGDMGNGSGNGKNASM